MSKPDITHIKWHGGAESVVVRGPDAKEYSDAGDRSLGRVVQPWDKNPHDNDKPKDKKLYDLGVTFFAVVLGISVAGWWAKNTPEGQHVYQKVKDKYEYVKDASDMYRDKDEPAWAGEAFEAK